MHDRGIRTARAYRGVTAKWVAEAAAISIFRLSRIERGRALPRDVELDRLARVLDADPRWLAEPRIAALDQRTDKRRGHSGTNRRSEA